MEKLELPCYNGAADPIMTKSLFISHIESFRPFLVTIQQQSGSVSSTTVDVDSNANHDDCSSTRGLDRMIEVLAQDDTIVDVSCEDLENPTFLGDSISREKINMKISAFIQGFEHLRLHGKGSHWTHDTNLNLFLSQACFFYNKDLYRDDSEPNKTDNTQVINGIEKSTCYPELLGLVGEEFPLLQANIWANFYESATNLHYDAYNNLLQVKYGSKKVLLVSPEFTDLLSAKSAASLTAPNHSNLSCELLSLLVDPRLPAGPVTDPATLQRFHNSRNILPHTPFRFYIAELDSSKILFIPEGWWHFVISAPATFAINHWFDSPLSKMCRTCPHMSSYIFRASFHDIVQNEMKKLDEELKAPHFTSKSRAADFTPADELDDPVAKRSKVSDATNELFSSERCQTCVYLDFCEAVSTFLAGSVHSAYADVQSTLVSMTYDVACWLLPSYAHNEPKNWTRLLLRLPELTVYQLTRHWDSWETAPLMAQLQPLKVLCDRHAVEPPSVVARAKDLDDFFVLIFRNCDDPTKVSIICGDICVSYFIIFSLQIRRHLFQSMDDVALVRAKKFLSFVV
jgi:hypothetical protein